MLCASVFSWHGDVINDGVRHTLGETFGHNTFSHVYYYNINAQTTERRLGEFPSECPLPSYGKIRKNDAPVPCRTRHVVLTGLCCLANRERAKQRNIQRVDEDPQSFGERIVVAGD